MKVKKMRAMTIQGFCLFANMAVSTWKEYEGQDAYSAIIAQVKAMFFSQKFEGAAADQLNPNIIARELGLAEKTDHNVKVNEPIEITYVVPKPDEG